MLVVSLRGVNLRILVPLKACTLKNMKIYLICIFLIRFIYSIHIIQVFSFACVLTWSLLVVKKAWATHRSVSFRDLIQNF